MNRVLFLMVGVVLAGCSGNAPRDPSEAKRPGDETMSCIQLADERKLNNERMANLTRQKAISNSGNYGTSIFNPSARNLSDREQAEIDNLDLRNQWLNQLGGTKGCG
ncbi:hypothetical protein KHP62_07320 [Rhodobacteraceae bacterium NNCM2]|nr:hypothetical protein [Coraliihabitans acroporae]